jgi:hypothetical protein
MTGDQPVIKSLTVSQSGQSSQNERIATAIKPLAKHLAWARRNRWLAYTWPRACMKASMQAYARACLYVAYRIPPAKTLFARERGEGTREGRTGRNVAGSHQSNSRETLEDRGRGEASIILWFVGLAMTGVFANLR